jgi:hypothetical protein
MSILVLEHQLVLVFAIWIQLLYPLMGKHFYKVCIFMVAHDLYLNAFLEIFILLMIVFILVSFLTYMNLKI